MFNIPIVGHGLGHLLKATGNTDLAEHAFRQADEATNNTPVLGHVKGHFHRVCGDEAKAWETWNKADEATDNTPVLGHIKGHVHRHCHGDEKRAWQSFHKANGERYRQPPDEDLREGLWFGVQKNRGFADYGFNGGHAGRPGTGFFHLALGFNNTLLEVDGDRAGWDWWGPIPIHIRAHVSTEKTVTSPEVALKFRWHKMWGASPRRHLSAQDIRNKAKTYHDAPYNALPDGAGWWGGERRDPNAINCQTFVIYMVAYIVFGDDTSVDSRAFNQAVDLLRRSGCMV